MFMTILDREAPERDESPGSQLPVDPRGIIGLLHIWTVADGDETL